MISGPLPGVVIMVQDAENMKKIALVLGLTLLLSICAFSQDQFCLSDALTQEFIDSLTAAPGVTVTETCTEIIISYMGVPLIRYYIQACTLYIESPGSQPMGTYLPECNISIEVPNGNDVVENGCGLGSNPFNPYTQIRYQLSSPNHVRLEIYNSLGKRIEVLVNAKKSAGIHYITWNAQPYASGIYYIRFTAGNFVAVKKGILLK